LSNQLLEIGLLVRVVREMKKMVNIRKKKKIEKGQQRYISRVRRGGTPSGGMMKLGTFIDPLDVMNRATFHLHIRWLFSGLTGGDGSQKKRFSLLNAFGSYNIALRYRADKWEAYSR
jgi:hypothetical protein